MAPAPLLARVGPRLLGRFSTVPRPSTAALAGRGDEAARLSASFAMHDDELGFARQIIERKQNLWVFRTNQRGFAGDFVIVDMSSPEPARRQAFVVELKKGSLLSLGGGGAGVQLTRFREATGELEARFGVLTGASPCLLLSGDARLVLGFLGAC